MPVTPTSAKLTNARSQQFTLVDAAGAAVARVAGPIAWTINPPAGSGTLDAMGMYTPPGVVAAAEVTVTATPHAGIAEMATVQLVPSEVLLTPNKVRLRAGERQQFTAIVPGDPANALKWTFAPTLNVQPGDLYTAPNVI
jgi:hypothetical protein